MGNVVGVAVAKLDLKAALKNFGVIPENTNFGIKSSVVRTLLEGLGINLRHPNATEVSRTELGRIDYRRDLLPVLLGDGCTD